MKDDLKDIDFKLIAVYSNKDSKRIDKYVERKVSDAVKLSGYYYRVSPYAFYFANKVIDYSKGSCYQIYVTVNCLIDFREFKIDQVSELDSKIIRKKESLYNSSIKLKVSNNDMEYFEPRLVAFLNEFYKEVVGLKNEVKETILERFTEELERFV